MPSISSTFKISAIFLKSLALHIQKQISLATHYLVFD